jgi:hypothetical protein
LTIPEKFKAIEWTVRVHVLMYAWCFSLKEPFIDQLKLLRYTPMYTVWTEALLETESGKTCGRYYERPAIHLSGLRDCKTLLAGDAPLGLGSGYEDLCNKGSTDQRTQKTMIED